MEAIARATRQPRVHYAWIVFGVTFVTLLIVAGVRAAPGVLIKPLEAEFGWDRASISFAVALSILWFGLGGPVAGGLVDRFGPRRVMLAGLGLITLGLLPLLLINQLWELHVFWGIVVGMGTGAVANVLGATIAHRWFKVHQGLIVGAFSAATSMGQLIFLPSLMGLTLLSGWRSAVALLIVAALTLIAPIALLMRDHPSQVGLRPVGDDGTSTAAERREEARGTRLVEAVRTQDFWLLAGSFFICGYTTNGLIGTHLIPHAVEHGFSEVTAASVLGVMGMMNIVGTLSSGWLTDRFDNRKLLATYYGFRALSIVILPFIADVMGLFAFAVVYGLDWIATVPPTAHLTATRFGKASLGTLYGWIFFSHMVGAALAAFMAGYLRETLGDYTVAFVTAGMLGFVAAALAMRIAPARRPALALA